MASSALGSKEETLPSERMRAMRLRATPPTRVKCPAMYQPPAPSGMASRISPFTVGNGLDGAAGRKVDGRTVSRIGTDVSKIAPDVDRIRGRNNGQHLTVGHPEVGIVRGAGHSLRLPGGDNGKHERKQECDDDGRNAPRSSSYLPARRVPVRPLSPLCSGYAACVHPVHLPLGQMLLFRSIPCSSHDILFLAHRMTYPGYIPGASVLPALPQEIMARRCGMISRG